MPTITIQDGPSFEVETGQRLILALRDQGAQIAHHCGGLADCTTCRVKFHAGEPERMTVAEHTKLAAEEGLLGVVRLSCQIQCTHDMTVALFDTLAQTGLDDIGQRPADHITPEPEWMDAPRG